MNSRLIFLSLLLILVNVIAGDVCDADVDDRCQPEPNSGGRSRRHSEKDSILAAKNVLDTVIALLSVKSKSNLNALLNFFKVSSPAVALLASLISVFVPSGTDPSELSVVVERLEMIDEKFELVRNDIKTLSDNVEFGQKVSLIFDPLVSIDLGSTYVTKFLQEQESRNVSIEENPWRRPLLEEVCPKIAKDIKTVLQVGNGAGTEILDSIFRTLYDKSRGDRQKLVDLGTVLSLSVRKGVLVFVKCESFQNNSRSVEQLLDLFSRDIKNLDCTIQTFITKAEKEACININLDANGIILEVATLSYESYYRNAEVSLRLKEQLFPKYNWLKFVVVVYNKDIKEYSEHAFDLPHCDSDAGFVAKLDVGQVNCLIYYSDRCRKKTCQEKKGLADSVISGTVDTGKGAYKNYERVLSGLEAKGIKEPFVYVVTDSDSDLFESSNDDMFYTPIRSVLPAELEAYDGDYGESGVSNEYHVGVIPC